MATVHTQAVGAHAARQDNRAGPVGRLACLNLGCGSRFHPDWVNVDLHPCSPEVRRVDLVEPLPFANRQFDVVYHSHVFEHLPPSRASGFLAECRRVLVPGGLLRMAVPDLEDIARRYLRSLELAWEGDVQAQRDCTWYRMELCDQMTRESSGGEMLDHLRADLDSIAWFRLGADGQLLRGCLATRPENLTALRRTWRAWLAGWRERILRRLLGGEYALLQLGRFRRSGEVHLAMYDRVALRALLADAGFTAFCVRSATQSAIPGWGDFQLDAAPDGRVHKPDSLFLEARKPW